MTLDQFVPINNYQTSNILIDQVMPLLTGNEWKVVTFMTRHINGHHDEGMSVDKITNWMFAGHWRFGGVGLTTTHLRVALHWLVEYRIVIPDEENNHLGGGINNAELSWTLNGTHRIDWPGLKQAEGERP